MPMPHPLRSRLAGSILLACSALPTYNAYAQAVHAAAAKDTVAAFDIPGQNLDDALAAYGIATGIQVLYPAELTRGLRSQPVSGRMDRQQALHKLLEGTGLGHRFTSARTVTLEADTAGAAQEQVLAPVTVRGEKITRDLQQTTTSSAVVSAYQIEQRRIQNLPDAFRMMANVRDSDWVDSGYLIRGINSEGVGGPAGRPLASVYVDGVAQTMQGARRGALGLWDVEQVEVQRGPQSTVSGRNALAGAIRIETKNPTNQWEGALRGTAGNFDTLGFAAMASGPIVEDKLAFRIAAERSHADDGIDYPTFHGEPRQDEREDDDYWQVRGKLLFTPQGEDGTRFLLSHSKSDDSPAYNDVDGPNWFDREWEVVGAEWSEARSTVNYNTALEIAQPLAEGIALTSLTTHVKSETSRPSVDLATRGDIDEKEISQELRLNWDKPAYTAVAGLYAAKSEDQTWRHQIRSYDPNVERRERSSSDVDNYAVFGELNWHLDDSWTLIGGLRYDYEQQDYKSVNQRANVTTSMLTSSSTTDGDTSYDAWLPKAGLMYQIDSRQNVGFTVQRAYRGGGTATNFVVNEVYDYDPEYAWNYELSYRSLWLDERVRLNANLFYLDWDDQQINVPQIPGDFTSDVVVNAGKSKIFGGEIELGVKPVAGLEIFASVGMAKTEFKEFDFVQNGVLLDLAGESFPQAPEWSAAAGADYRLGQWFIGGDLKYTGSTTSRSLLEGADKDRLPVYTVLNLRTGYNAEHWTVTLWANNVTDEEYFLYRFDQPSGHYAAVGRERVAGVTVDIMY